MAHYEEIDQLPLIGGSAALDFVNTMVSRHGRLGPDLLASYDDLLTFFERTLKARWEVIEHLTITAKRDAPAAERTLNYGRKIREAIGSVFDNLAQGHDPNPAKLEKLVRAAKRSWDCRQLAHLESNYRWVWSVTDDLSLPVNAVAATALELLLDGGLHARIRACPGSNCGWLFVDTSKNGRRKWCSEADCGAVARMKRHRQRNPSALDT